MRRCLACTFSGCCVLRFLGLVWLCIGSFLGLGAPDDLCVPADDTRTQVGRRVLGSIYMFYHVSYLWFLTGLLVYFLCYFPWFVFGWDVHRNNDGSIRGQLVLGAYIGTATTTITTTNTTRILISVNRDFYIL